MAWRKARQPSPDCCIPYHYAVPPRVLIVTQHYAPEITACAFRWTPLARSMAALGADVTVLTCFPNYPSGRVAEGYHNALRSLEEPCEGNGGVRILRAWTWPAGENGVLPRVLSQLAFLSAGRFAGESLGPFDVVLGTSPPLGAAELGAALAARWRVTFIMEVRDLWPDVIFDTGYGKLRPFAPLLYRWEKCLYGRAALVTTVTPSFIPLLQAKGVDPARLRVMPPQVDPAAIQPAAPEAAAALREQLGLGGKRVALYLGNHAVSQGLDVVVEAARLLRQDAHILLVGEGWEKPALIARAQALGLTNITFAPPVPRVEVAAYYALADVCLVTLRASGFMQHFLPSKLIEVLAYGKPVLTNIGGAGAALVRELGAGRVLSEYMPEALAEALRGMLSAPPALDAAALRAEILGRYSTQSVAQSYLAAVEEAVHSNSR